MAPRFDIAVIGGGASAEAFLAGLAPEARRKVAVIAPLSDRSGPGQRAAGPVMGAKASPKLRNRELQRSATDWHAHFPGVLQADRHFFYTGFARGGGTRFWGNSVATFDAADLVSAGLSPDAIAAANRMMAVRVAVAGNIDDVLSDRFSGFPRTEFPFRSPRIARMDGSYGSGRFLVGASRNAMTPAVPQGRCTGCAGCINGCAFGALWQSQIGASIAGREDVSAVDGWVRAIDQVTGGYRVDFDLADGGQDHITARTLCLAVDPVMAFALLAPLAGENADAPLFNAPAIAWIAATLDRRPATPGFGLAHAQVHVMNGPSTTAFGHIFEGAPITLAAMPVLSDNAVVDQLFRLALPNMVLGNLFFRTDAPRAHLHHRGGTISLESAGSRAIDGLGPVLGDLRAFCRANGMMLLTHRLSQPGSDLHYAGGVPRELRTGRAHATQLHGLHVVGGAALNFLPPQSPTFPYMAAAFALAQQWE